MDSFPTWVIALLLLLSFFVLGKAADLIVRALTNLGARFKISVFALSFVLLGLTTSLPEMMIGVYSVLDQVPRLSFGNLIGGVIILLTLVLGLNGLVAGRIAVDGKFASYTLCKILPRVPFCGRLGIHDLGIIAALLLAPALLLIDGVLSRFDGAVLVVLYILFVWYYLREQVAPPAPESAPNGPRPSFAQDIWRFVVGAVLMVAVARLVVDSSEVLFTRFSISPFLFGLLALAVGTNLPELAIMIRASGRARDISVGNVLGSSAANVFIIGLLNLAAPLTGFGRQDILFSGWMLVIVALLLLIFFRTRNELSRWESLLLVLLYIVFFVVQSFLRPTA